MMKRIVVSSCAAAALSLAMSAAAQSNVQTPTQSPVPANQQGTRTQAPPTSGAQGNQQVTIVGCVRAEGDGSRTAAADARATEFVLANAMPANAASIAESAAAGAGSSTATRSTGTSGSTRESAGVGAGVDTTATAHPSAAMTYSLTGDRERDLAQYVGQRVEIVATMANSATTAAAPGTVGTSGIRDRTRVPQPESTTSPGATVSDQPTRSDSALPQPGAASSPAAAAPMPRAEIVSFRALGTSCQ